MPKLAFNPDPVVGVLPHKMMKGMRNPEDSVGAMEFYKLSDTMQHLWSADHHTVFYSAVEPSGQPGICPRLNKGIEQHVRQAGGDVVSTCFGFDFDNPDHLPWAPGQFARWLTQLEAIGHQWPEVMKFQWLYSTRNGARLVYVLSEPLPVELAEAKHRGMVQMFARAGMAPDPQSDWTRLFRLPKVHRDQLPTTQEPDHIVLGNPGAWLDISLIHEVDPMDGQAYDTIHTISDPKPDPEEARQLLQAVNPDTGYPRKSEWFKTAKRRLTNRECFPCIFEHKPMADRGNRNNAIHSFVGQACSMLINIPNTTPQHIYALFLETVMQFDPEPDTPDWTTVLWDHCCRIWAKEDAKLRAQLKEVLPDAERATTLAQQMVTGMRSWNDHPLILGDDQNKAMGFLLRHAVVSVGRFLYLMQTNGHYSCNALSSQQLVAELMCRGMTDIIPVQKMNPGTNVIAKVQPQEIQDKYSVAAQTSVEYQPNLVGGYLRNLGKPNMPPKLVLPCFRLNSELTPRFDQGVDQWLRIMFGSEYELFERWCQWALAYTEGPIAALSIVGAPGTGKKLVAEGLAECLEDPQLASAEDIVGSFNGGLLRSPFVVVDEGWPEVSNQLAANAFRHLIDDRVYVNEKYRPPAEVMTKPRVILTANNLNIIRTLTGKGSMSVNDRHALSQRLLHFNVGDRSARWLRDAGGMGFTARPGRRWIADARGGSDFILARHFLHLHAMRGQKPSTRYLVEGNGNHEIIFSMQTETGSTPIVIETIIKMLNSSQGMRGLIISGNRLYVLASEIVDFFRLYLANTIKERVTANIVAASLKSLTLTENFHATSRSLAERPGMRRHWHDLDCRLIRKVAERIGNESVALDMLADGQEREFGPLDPEASDPTTFQDNARVLS